MKYTYAYKTSDGTRHEASIEAASREEVFAALRKAGIKAIKVVASDGSRANGEIRGVRKRLVASITAAVLVLGIGIGIFLSHSDETPDARDASQNQYSADEKAAFQVLLKKANMVAELHRSDMQALHLDTIPDAQTVRTTNDLSRFEDTFRQAHVLIDTARRRTKDVFAGIAADFTSAGAAMKDAQRLYGERMGTLDAEEIELTNRRTALTLLDRYRDEWTLEEGKPVFSNPRLALMYRYCLDGIAADGDTARWKKDFENRTVSGELR